jgi:hypothetical protein
MTAYPRAEAAGVRKAPKHEIAAGGSAAAVPQALLGFGRLTGLESWASCDGYSDRTAAQLKRYGPNFAQGGIHVLSHP